MKTVKIYIQYPWGVSDSLYYKSLIENPPESVRYVGNKKRQGMIINKKKFLLINSFKKAIRTALEKMQLPIPNVHETICQEDYDLIHCAHCLSKNKTNWVADFESLWGMWVSGRDTKKGREKVLKLLKEDNCKKIIAWTDYTKKEIISKFPEIENKVITIPFAMYPLKVKKDNHKTINLLFVGRYFYQKGGLHTLDVFDKLTKKYENVKCVFVSSTPKEIVEKYSSNEKIKFYDLMEHQRLVKEIFPRIDIFVCPGYSDTFGFSFIEAMSIGLPIVTVDGYARKDIVNEGETGFIIPRVGHCRTKIETHEFGDNEKKIIEGIIEKTSLLIENRELREKMSTNGREVVKKGKFSINERNMKLKKIYEEAVK